DQLYADTVWHEVPALVEWRKEPWRKRRHMGFSPEMAEATGDYYFRRYCWLWAQPETASILAQVPSLMMWDDHDIFDGWGSYATGWEQCDVFQGIYAAAREHFSLFQLAAKPDDLPDGFSDPHGGQFGWAYRIGDIGIIAPDLRSERTLSTIIGEAGWRALMNALDGMAGCSHILLISTVPLVNAHLTALERFFEFIPGHQSWQDDLIDQWPSRAHWSEWQRMLDTLTAFSVRTGAAITSLSGEIHLGALGLIQSGDTRIHQLTSSGVVHPPPSALATTGLDWASRGTIRLSPDITVKSLPITGSRRYLRTRNWLELDIRGDRLNAVWHHEGGPPESRPTISIEGG
ncbi:MAG TPA: hypothetical protein VFJ18_04880, partial [Pararhizobium sp.]|nr:hypothetical protein [Pararhizobium sp.]